MLLRLSLNALFIIFARFSRMMILCFCTMDSSKKFTKETRRVRLQYRLWLFPFVTKYMDRRIDSYLSLFYECENYTLEDLCEDLVSVLRVKQPFAIQPSFNREPIYQQLTLF